MEKKTGLLLKMVLQMQLKLSNLLKKNLEIGSVLLLLDTLKFICKQLVEKMIFNI